MTVIDLRVPGRRDGRLRTTWTRSAQAPRGWAWVQHGFARSARHLEGVAGLLADHGFVVVRPDLASFTPWHSMHDRTYLTAVTLTVARSIEAGIPQSKGIDLPFGLPWIGVGHSAGSAVVGHAAAVLAGRGDGPRGLVLLDPVDTVGQLLQGALPGISGLPIRALACPPSRCNRHGATVDLLAPRAEVTVTWMDHVSHADPERIPARLVASAVPAEGWAVARVCGPGGAAPQIVAMGEWTRDSAIGLLDT